MFFRWFIWWAKRHSRESWDQCCSANRSRSYKQCDRSSQWTTSRHSNRMSSSNWQPYRSRDRSSRKTCCWVLVAWRRPEVGLVHRRWLAYSGGIRSTLGSTSIELGCYSVWQLARVISSSLTCLLFPDLFFVYMNFHCLYVSMINYFPTQSIFSVCWNRKDFPYLSTYIMHKVMLINRKYQFL